LQEVPKERNEDFEEETSKATKLNPSQARMVVKQERKLDDFLIQAIDQAKSLPSSHHYF
jgi:hypothetical protein